MTNWCYWKDEIGPKHWSKNYPIAAGHRQSPIDITKQCVQYDPKLKATSFNFTYVSSDCYELLNKGMAWSIKIKPDGKSFLSADHLPGKFKLAEIHCHWGSRHGVGSEHLVDGFAYSAEIHMVHWNTKYNKFDEALKQPDGLAVLGIFLKEEHNENKAFVSLCEYLKHIPYKDDKVGLPNGMNFKDFLPSNLDFWTYEGSLTTPPCAECVLWTVFKTPVPISKEQLDVFRHLHYVVKGETGICAAVGIHTRKIVNNYRPAQDICDRKIGSSFA